MHLASEIFSKEEALSFEDDRFDYGEIRKIALSKVEGVVLYVVFTTP